MACVGSVETSFLEHDPPGTILHQAYDGTEGGRFAGAVAAEQRDHFALADFERDIEQDVRRSVEAVEVFDLEFSCAGSLAVARVVDQPFAEIDGAHCGLPRTSSGEPSAIRVPRLSTGYDRLFEHHVHVVFGKSTPIDVRGRCARSAASVRCVRAAPCRVARPSTAVRLVGECDRKFQPLEIAVSELARRDARHRRPSDEIEQPAASSARSRVEFHRLNNCRPYDTSSTCTFSRTVMVGNVAVIWKVRPTRAADRARLPGRGVLAEQIDPPRPECSGRSACRTGAFSSAVGSISARIFTGAQLERHTPHGMNAA